MSNETIEEFNTTRTVSEVIAVLNDILESHGDLWVENSDGTTVTIEVENVDGSVIVSVG